MGGKGRKGGRGSYLQRSPLIKNPSAEITHPTLRPSLPRLSFFPRVTEQTFIRQWQAQTPKKSPSLFCLCLTFTLSLSVQLFTSFQLLAQIHRELTVWQLARMESSYFGIHITGLLACVLTAHKTNTFLAVNENKMRARDESERDLRARLIYMCRNTICSKKGDGKHIWNPIRETTHTPSIIHTHACVHMLTALSPMPSERLSSSDHHAWAHSTRKGRCKAKGRGKEGWRGAKGR